MSPHLFQDRVLTWFDRYGRKNLPWQQNITPYRVWVSEIMLQQTQVTTVIPYYQKFMSRFPDIETLAAASEDDVLKHWSGLGYYARARNLHKSAQMIIDNGGRFPDTLESLIDLPGVGRSTAGAILSIAGNQTHPILDGNVKRVLTRFHGVYGWSGDPKISKVLWELSGRYTPRQRTADYTQAMMDMGATLCTRSKPKCESCPVSSGCYAFREAKTGDLPTPKPRKKIPVKDAFLLLLKDAESRILLQKRASSGIWGGLWSLPEFSSLDDLRQWCDERSYPLRKIEILPSQRHTFSHYHLDYIAVIVNSENLNNNVMEANQAVWYKIDTIDSLGLPAPVKRLLQEQIIEENYDENG